MDVRRLRKEVGFSWIEVKNIRYEFVVKDVVYCNRE